ncbi:MAG: ABC transporter ATP-binding protein [Candidatus Omnitrophica bacterium]|nr:ABC transporter ATP-binding protein [Candidatus Omnitrophota bacterium]
MNDLFVTQSVRKRYVSGNDQVLAIDGIDLVITQGEYVAVIGPSGSGKSTLLHMLGGLDMPSGGEVLYRGKDIYRLSDKELARWRNETVGFVFQFYHLLGELTVSENVSLPMFLRNRDRKSALKKGIELLQYLGIPEKKDSFPAQLSGGQKQKVALARALINDPDILFCDEPTGNLDKESSTKVMSLLQEWHNVKHRTLVMVTHNESLTSGADRVLYLHEGKIETVSSGT